MSTPLHPSYSKPEDSIYVVEFPDGSIEYINKRLAISKDLPMHNLVQIESLWQERWAIFQAAKKLEATLKPDHSNFDAVKATYAPLVESYKALEFKLQDAWRFPKSEARHNKYDLPGCTCLKAKRPTGAKTALQCVAHGKLV